MTSGALPRWLQLGQQISSPVFQAVLDALRSRRLPDASIQATGELALFHVRACLNASIDQNQVGQPAVALALLRQCIEALTVVDASLQRSELAIDLLQRWVKSGSSTGALRKELANHAWPRYGTGLWDEPWGDFFSNLSKSVHPYAHYSNLLQQWQISIVSNRGSSDVIAMTSHMTVDQVKFLRVALLHMLVIWAVGRIFLGNSPDESHKSLRDSIAALGSALSESKMLFRSKDWADELLPHIFFNEGANWNDD